MGTQKPQNQVSTQSIFFVIDQIGRSDLKKCILQCGSLQYSSQFSVVSEASIIDLLDHEMSTNNENPVSL